MNSRIDRLRELFPENEVDSLLVSRPSDVTYLSGFTGEDGFLLILPVETILLIDFRYLEQAEGETSGITLREIKGKIVDLLPGLRGKLGRFGIDSSHLIYSIYAAISEKLGVKPHPVKNPVSALRAVKDTRELDLLRKSARTAQDVFLDLKGKVHPGMTEKDVADEIEYLLRKSGASSSSFPTIVASAANASLPHHTVSQRVIENGDAVLVDWGGYLSQYASDTTRMLFLGEPSREHREIYAAVLEAQSRAFNAFAPGKSGVEVDGAARNFLAERGYGNLFGHGLGHGVGLEVHELPRLSPLSEDVLEEGMVVTVEPGVYKREWGGIRIEDMVVVTDEGCDLITDLPRDIEAAVI